MSILDVREPELRCTNVGREIRLDGRTIAIATSPLAAQALAMALQWIGAGELPPQVGDCLSEFLA